MGSGGVRDTVGWDWVCPVHSEVTTARIQAFCSGYGMHCASQRNEIKHENCL
jgi:hypothetical protein